MHQRLSAAILCFDYTTGKKKPPVPGAKFCPVPAGFSFGPHRGPFFLCPLLFRFRNWFSLYKSANGHGEPTKVFVHLFQKVVGRRGKAPLALRRGRNTFSFTKRRRGAKRPGGTFGGGEPSPGVLPCGYCRISSLPPFYSAFATNSHSTKMEGVFRLPPPYTSPATTKGSSPFGILRLPTHCVALGLFQRFPLFASVCCLFSVSAKKRTPQCEVRDLAAATHRWSG